MRELSESPDRDKQEVDFLIALGVPLIWSQGLGTPEVGSTYSRARELCEKTGDSERLFEEMAGLYRYNFNTHNMRKAEEISCQLLDLARNLKAHTLLGSVREGKALMNEARQLALELPHPASKGLTLFYAAMQHQALRNPDEVRKLGQFLREYSEEHVATIGVPGIGLEGWAMCVQGEREAGIERLRESIARMRTMSHYWIEYMLFLMTDACATTGRIEEGRRALKEAWNEADPSGSQWLRAELLRLQGCLQDAEGDYGSAEESFLRALEVAREQSARFWELRTAVSLARMQADQQRIEEARSLLQTSLDAMPEESETIDRHEALELLERLR